MNITSKLLVALLFSIASASTKAMNPLQPAPLGTVPEMAENNDVQLLGEPLVKPSDISLRQKLDSDAAKAKKSATTSQQRQQALDNKKYWTNVAKITGFATLVGALAVKWLYSKK